MILGHPAGLRGHLRRGWVGPGFGDPKPGSGSPFPFLQARGPAFPCLPPPSRPHPLLQALAHRRSPLDPRALLQPAGTVQVHTLRSASEGLARDSEARVFPEGSIKRPEGAACQLVALVPPPPPPGLPLSATPGGCGWQRSVGALNC